MVHPLDRPIWQSLASDYRNFAVGDDRARRFDPNIHFFAAAADQEDDSQMALAALAGESAPIALVEATPVTPPRGLRIERAVPLDQMLLDRPFQARGGAVSAVPLGDPDAEEMLALAALTRPGPFFTQTHRMGGFVGVRDAGRLVAMAGQRLKLPGFTEVSAVCTHPDYRGRGLAPALMAIVIDRILARGEQVFLHAFPDNPAIRLYSEMGFTRRATMTLTICERLAACASAASR